MIEIGGVEAKDIKVNYKLFKVNARVSGRNLLVASVNGNGELSWLHDNVPGAPVREAVEEMEYGHDGTQDVHRKLVRGIGLADYPRATNDVTLQPEFIRLHVLTKNLQSVRDQSRWEDLLVEFEVCDCDVGFFTGTWRSKRRECFEMSSGRRVFLSGGGSRQGVGIGISARLWRLIDDVSFHAYSSRVCLLNFSICALKFSMLSVYFPTSWDDDSEIETMYELLQLILNNVHCSGARIVIGGDFNANVGSLQWSDEQDVVGEWGSGLRNARGATLISWILMNGLRIASRQSPTNNVDDSWICQRTMDGARVQLDFILTDARA